MKSLIKQLQDGEITISKFIKELDNMEKTRTITPKLGEKVLVWDDDERDADECIFLAKVEGEFSYATFYSDDAYDRFKDGSVTSIVAYKNMKPLPQVETVSLKEALSILEAHKGVKCRIEGCE